MNEVTKILQAAESGEPAQNVTEKLLPVLYDELRRLAAHQMAGVIACETFSRVSASRSFAASP